MNNSIKER